MYLGENIKFLRTQNKLSQDYIAERYGYKSYTTVQKWESNVADPPATVIQDLARLFNVSIDDLCNAKLYLGETTSEDNLYKKIDLDTIRQLNDDNITKVNTYAQNLLNIQQMEEPVLMAAHHDNPTPDEQAKMLKDMDLLRRPNK